jgi:hypothetical protein
MLEAWRHKVNESSSFSDLDYLQWPRDCGTALSALGETGDNGPVGPVKCMGLERICGF